MGSGVQNFAFPGSFGRPSEEENMDKLAKRAGVAALIVVAAAGSAFALGMARYASSLETSGVGDTPRLVAALRLPAPAPPAAVAPPTLVLPLVVEIPKQAAGAPQRLEAAPLPQKQAPPKKLALRATAVPASEGRDLTPEPVADDMLNLDFGGNEREAKLAERGPHAFGARQLGGAEEKHHRVIPGERVTFETDLAKPGDH